ncbi:AraC-like DNA-binding protein [Gelidibacter algens]|uniref:AraC-like DNA-binding protein n=1 Tax=Gelidibacter algens TaxID=49280 RepID=A0A1A7QYP9_9FLAO|nr:AraC family transcriptional regulator [Gelidibacter algens]OBX24691.1 hypothetical protein A9996_13805 [Gelidibacter algens]RAJ19179.1 AraC-like DNA-binding protein [Gelidibacter algens]
MFELKNIYDLKIFCWRDGFIFFLIALAFNSIIAQNKPNEISQTNSFDGLRQLFNELPTDSLYTKRFIAKIYLQRAKEDNDTINIGRGYYLHSVLMDGPLKAKRYADSIILFTKNSNDFSYPAAGYFLKGYWCYELSQYQEALDSYLIGDSIAKKRGNTSQSAGYKRMIALLKNRAGDHRGALKIYLKEIDSLNLVKSKSSANYSNYLNILYNTSLTYMRLKQLDSAKLYSVKGLNESLVKKDSIVYFEFMYNLGVIEYLLGNENQALINIDTAIPYLDDYSQAMANYYKGKIAIHNQSESDAHQFFRISDSIAGQLNYTFPELRSIYEFKIDYYEKNLDLQSQLLYINKLLKLDSTLYRSKDLQLQIEKKYNRPLLIQKKETVINALRDKNKFAKIINLLLGTATVVLISMVVWYRIRQRKYLEKFKILIENDNDINSQKLKNRRVSDMIPLDIYNNIAMDLEKFESQNQFLQPVTLVELAKRLDTNSTYLSKFINIHTGSNFSQYVNKLRILYIVEKLKSDSKLRAFTIKAIGEGIGFGTTQSFSKAFYHETGIYPSYYLRKLNEN